MKETDRIADMLRRAYEGEAWHGPALRELLEGVSAAQAAARRLPSAHSIWEIVLHIAAWEDIVRRRIGGEKVEVTAEMDWPPVADTSEAAWSRALATLEKSNRTLREAITWFESLRLGEKPDDRTSIYTLMHGAIQHDLYHAGQIALLRKGTT